MLLVKDGALLSSVSIHIAKQGEMLHGCSMIKVLSLEENAYGMRLQA